MPIKHSDKETNLKATVVLSNRFTRMGTKRYTIRCRTNFYYVQEKQN